MHPKHDVWYSGNGDSQLRAAETGLVDEYRSALLPLLHDWALRQGELARGRAIGVHAAVVGIGYNSKALANKRLPEPRCWADLARPEYRNELHFVNPSASRVGYTTLATLVQVFGEERAFELMKAIHRNAGSYAITANGAIRAVARAETTIGVAMLHDGATEIANGFPVQLIVPCEGTGYEVGSIALVANAPHPANARRFYDWALTPAAQGIRRRHAQLPLPGEPRCGEPARRAGCRQPPPDPLRLRQVRDGGGTQAPAREVGARRARAAAMTLAMSPRALPGITAARNPE